MDAAELQVLISRLTGVAEEMGAVLRRAAYSPNIKERADCSAALFTADGTLLVQAEHIPVHLGSMPAAVRAAIDAWGSRLAPGEQVILNDPFAGGTHLNDVTMVAPAFAATAPSSAGPRTVRITPTWAAWRPDRCRRKRPRSTKKGCASRRCATRRRSRRSSSPRPARRTNGAAISTRSAGRTDSA